MRVWNSAAHAVELIHHLFWQCISAFFDIAAAPLLTATRNDKRLHMCETRSRRAAKNYSILIKVMQIGRLWWWGPIALMQLGSVVALVVRQLTLAPARIAQTALLASGDCLVLSWIKLGNRLVIVVWAGFSVCYSVCKIIRCLICLFIIQ